MYKVNNTTLSKNRYSSIQRVSLYPTKYAIKDYKLGIYIPITTISYGRYICNSKKFSKLADITWRHLQERKQHKEKIKCI